MDLGSPNRWPNCFKRQAENPPGLGALSRSMAKRARLIFSAAEIIVPVVIAWILSAKLGQQQRIPMFVLK